MDANSKPDLAPLRALLATRAAELGFAQLGIAGIDLAEDEIRLRAWLNAGRHGAMDYMARHGTRRSRPAELLPGTLRVISARMDYWPREARNAHEVLGDDSLGYVSRYALGRDYHKLMRKALQQLADYLAGLARPHGHRVFVDSAPVLEKALARNAGLGWIGKHTNLIARDAGSYFFLGEIYTDLELPLDEPASAHCGSCTACMPACPTGAIVAPWQLDARRCISYLTIELKEAIPADLRARSAIASTAVMTASSSAPGTVTRATPRTPISRCAMASTRRAWPTCSAGPNRNSRNA
jgi:epoxyqueuosine reductase